MRPLHIARSLVFGAAICVNASARGQDYEQHVENGLAVFHARNYRAALEEFGRAISLDPQRASAYYLRGYTYLALEEQQDALSDFRRTIKIRRDRAEAYLGRASMRSANGEHSGGLEDAKTDNQILFEHYRRLSRMLEIRYRARSPSREIQEGMEVDRLQRERRYREFKRAVPPSRSPAAKRQLEA